MHFGVCVCVCVCGGLSHFSFSFHFRGPHSYRFALASHGSRGITDAVEATLATTRAIASLIRTRDFLELVMDPELSVVLFRRVGWAAEEYHSWSDRELAKGLCWHCVIASQCQVVLPHAKLRGDWASRHSPTIDTASRCTDTQHHATPSCCSFPMAAPPRGGSAQQVVSFTQMKLHSCVPSRYGFCRPHHLGG